MIFYSALFTGFFLFALILRTYRSVFYNLAEHSVALVNQLLSDHEEDVKISQVQEYTNRLVLSMLRMFLVVIVAAVIGSIPVVLLSLISGTGYSDLVFSSFYSILFISLGATVPFLLPFKKKQANGYSELSRLLHRMALDNYYISNKLFKRETRMIRKKDLQRKKEFVIVSGLARAGTTSLMNDLSRIEQFVSLSYANMPFVLCPNTWAKFYRPKSREVKERSHKDGIMIGLDSNEALEEYFFKVKANDSYIDDDHLAEYEISPGDYAEYLDYQSLIKRNNSKTYLAKNNNFLLRYRSLREYNDDFIMVILYRDPLFHAASLMEKHLEYLRLQKEDPFILEYMNWLGHHEFGANQKPFVFRGQGKHPVSDKESLDYWLIVWTDFYRIVLAIQHPNTLIVNYESYCNDPAGTINAILKRSGITAELPEYRPFVNRRKVNLEFSDEVYAEAREVYRHLRNNVK